MYKARNDVKSALSLDFHVSYTKTIVKKKI